MQLGQRLVAGVLIAAGTLCYSTAFWVVSSVSPGAESITLPTAVASSHLDVGLARVVAQPGETVNFVQLLEHECRPGLACSNKNPFLVDGDRVVTGGQEDQRVYVWFRGRGESMRGWLPSTNVKDLAFDTHPALEKWVGTWIVGEKRKIVIELDRTKHQLTLTGHAKWYGARLENGYQVVHTGDVRGTAPPDGNRLTIRNGDDSDCVLDLELVDKFLAATDNTRCGGMNVSFGAVYTRDASNGRSLK